MKRFRIIIILAAFPTVGFSQLPQYYYGVNGRILDGPENAIKIKTVKKKSKHSFILETKVQSSDGWRLIKKERIKERKNNIQKISYHGNTLFPRFYQRKIVNNQGIYSFTDLKLKYNLKKGTSTLRLPLHYEGIVQEYYRNGQIKSESFYRDNMLVNNKNWNEDGSEYISNIFYSTDMPPVYPGGSSAINKYLVSKIIEENLPIHEIQDEIIIEAVIMESGKLNGVRVQKGRVESINKFFIETISSLPGEWKPAVLNGKNVRYHVTIPINFKNRFPAIRDIEITKGGQLIWSD